MKKSILKVIRGSSIALASSALIAAATVGVVQTTSSSTTDNALNARKNSIVSSTNATVAYEPITINEGYNCNTIISSSSTKDSSYIGWRGVNGADDPHLRSNQTEIEAEDWNTANLYLDSVASGTKSGLPAPVNGFTTVTSQNTNTSGLTWKVPVGTTEPKTEAEIVKNTMKLYDINTESTRKGTFTFSDFGVYTELYILCIAAGTQSEQTVKFSATINYTDGTKTSKEYTVYDWFPTDANYKTLCDNGLFGTSKYYRFWGYGSKGKDGTTTWKDGTGSKQVVLNQCPIQVDTTKIVKSLAIELTETKSDNAVLDVYGVTGAIAGDVLAPVSIKTHADGANGIVTWKDHDDESACNTTKYFLDVYHQSGGETVWDVNSRELDAETYKTTHKYTITGDDKNNPLTEGVEYTVRMRAGNAAGAQSENSNTDTIIIDKTVVPNKVYCYVLNGTKEETSFTIPVGKKQTVYTRVINETSGGKHKDQAIDHWNIPDAYKDKIKINPKTSSNDEDTSFEFSSTIPITSTAVTATAHAEEITSDNLTASVSVNAPEWDTTTVAAKTATLKWKQPEIGETTAANNTYTVEVKDPDGTVIKTANNLPYTTTQLALTGLTSDTTYTATITLSCVYSGTTYTSDATKLTFKTNACDGVKIDGTSSLSFDWTGTLTAAKEATTTINSTSEGAATTQDLTWTATTDSNGSVSQTHTDFTKDTTTTWTVTPTAPGKVIVNLASTKYGLTKTLTINITPVGTSISGTTKLTPVSFTANWNAVDWAEGYRITLYKGDTQVESHEVDSTVTTYPFSNLTYNTSYKYTVEVICKDAKNNNVYSSAATKTQLTPTSYPTELKATINGEEIPSNTINTIIGSTITVDTKLVGEEFDGTVFDASNQTVTTNKGSETNLNVVESKGSNEHKYTVVGDLSGGQYITAFDLVAESADRDGHEVSKTLYLNYAPMNAITGKNFSETGFDVSWNALDSSLIQSSDNVQYVIEYTTDPTFAKFDSITTKDTSVSLTNLLSSTTYYVRARYTNNGYSSNATEAQRFATEAGLTSFGLDKNIMTIVGTGSNDVNTITGTLTTTGASLPIVWQIEDEEIAEFIDFPTNSSNGEITSTKIIKPKKTGTTYIKAWPEGKTNFTQTCKLTIVKGTLDPLVLKVKDITTDSFILYWNPITDWSGNQVKYKVSVWALTDDGQKSYILKDSITANPQKLVSKQNTNVINGVTYHCIVHAFNDHFETNEANEIQVRLLDYGMPLWQIILISTGSTIAGLFLLALALYHLWKNSILKTYNKDKLKYTKGGKPKTHDKIFRAMDKVIVAMNIKIMKRTGTLYTTLGTKEEQQSRKNYRRRK